MAKQEQEQQEQPKLGAAGKAVLPPLPKATQKRVSMKWLTLDALSKVMTRLKSSGGAANVLLLTPFGQVEGSLNEIRPSYAESFVQEVDGGGWVPDVASMVTNVRSDLLRAIESEEQEVQVMDIAPILSLTDVVITDAAGTRTLPQLTLFADQVVGFTLTEIPKVH